MSLKRIPAIALTLCIGLITACDRGSHPTQVAQKAPAFTIHDGAKTISLDQYRGKVVVLNFWASWCPPCLEELPTLIQLQQQMPGITVLAVSFDQDADAYRQFITDHHMDKLTTILDLSQKSNLAYGTTRPPETFVIDQQGNVRRKFIGPQNWTNPEILNYLKNL